MWIVRLALRRPYTFVVMAMMVVILFVVTVASMPIDIFPNINIPVVAVAFNYSGMTPGDMEQRIVTNFEGALTTTVNDIEHVDSQSLNGVSVIKVYFQPDANLANSLSQVTAIAQTAIRSMPPGTQPPLIIQYNASNVPVLQLSLSSDTLTEQQLFDYGNQYIRPGLAVVQGVQIALALRRQSPPDHGRSRSRKTLRLGNLPQPGLRRHRRPESRHPLRHHQDRQAGIPRHSQQQPPAG